MMMDDPMLDDLISNKLPNEILIEILSCLSMKEAARTSVVSHRWESLWKFYHGCMDFDFEDPKSRKPKNIYGKALCEKASQTKYVNWVNQVIGSHQGGRTSIEQLRIHFELDRDDSSNIDRWIGFAAAGGVRRLELDFSGTEVVYPGGRIPHLERFYSLPAPITNVLSKFPAGDFRQLISLSLKSLNVADEHVSYFLCNCPNLEELSFTQVPCLRNVKVVAAGAALKLKHLEIRRCDELQHLEVSMATNLVSFAYVGKINSIIPVQPPSLPNMHFQDVPQLSSISLGLGDFTRHLVATTGFREVPFPMAQLHTLMVCILPHYGLPHQEFAAQFTNLRQLELSFWVVDEQSVLFVGSFLQASPALSKMVLKCDRNKKGWYLSESHRIESNHRYRQLVQGCKYECLKEVEFLGWTGLNGDLDLATHLTEAAAGSLERVKVDPRNPFLLELGFDYGVLSPRERAPLEDARKRARDLLEPKLSPITKLVVI